MRSSSGAGRPGSLTVRGRCRAPKVSPGSRGTRGDIVPEPGGVPCLWSRRGPKQALDRIRSGSTRRPESEGQRPEQGNTRPEVRRACMGSDASAPQKRRTQNRRSSGNHTGVEINPETVQAFSLRAPGR
eukprot:14185710-Alexandrium_andersonii.AAC.1